ncbi:NUDIX hydrolase [Geodermatophilus sp. URMC 63]
MLTRETVVARLRDLPRRAADRPELKAAAVAVCITCTDGVTALLVTRRAAGLRAHAGQWALPGGRLDPGETPVQAALRELEEEVGLVRGPDDVLGLLDDYVTRSGYVMTPVVVWAGATGELAPAEAEVAAAYQVPVADLDVDPVLVSIPESDAPVIRLPLLGGWVHAPTAAVVYQFCQVVCRGLHTRVAHLEQPVFAWR